MNPADGVPAAHQAELMIKIDEMQVRDSLRMYNSLVERCFRDCVDTFRRKDLEPAEEKCVQKCCEKYMKHSSRVGLRFAELSSQAEAQVAGIMKGGGK